MHGRDRSRARRALAVGALTICLALGMTETPVAQAGPLRTKLLGIINRIRENHDLRALRLNVGLSEDAKRHTRRMIRRGKLFDPPHLEELLDPYDWTVAGSAVGCDATPRALVRAWLASDLHRSVVLGPRFRRAGVGVTRVDGGSFCGPDRVFATLILYG